MNWEAVGALAELVGATAVVISLVYLAVQIRHNSRQVEEQVRGLRLQAYDAAGADFSALRLQIGSSPQLASAWRRAKEEYSGLAPDEQAQVNELLHELMWAFQNIIARMDGGTEDHVLRWLTEVNIPHWMRHPGFREWWRTEYRNPYTEEFSALVDEVCRRLDEEAAYGPPVGPGRGPKMVERANVRDRPEGGTSAAAGVARAFLIAAVITAPATGCTARMTGVAALPDRQYAGHLLTTKTGSWFRSCSAEPASSPLWVTFTGESVQQIHAARADGVALVGDTAFVRWRAAPTDERMVGPGGPALLVRRIDDARPAAEGDCRDGSREPRESLP